MTTETLFETTETTVSSLTFESTETSASVSSATAETIAYSSVESSTPDIPADSEIFTSTAAPCDTSFTSFELFEPLDVVLTTDLEQKIDTMLQLQTAAFALGLVILAFIILWRLFKIFF